MKKWLLAMSLTVSVVALAACNNGSDAVVETNAGEISKDEFYEAMKSVAGEAVATELIYDKILSAKYEVTDEEVNAKVDELKAQLGTNFEVALQSYGYKSEDDLKKVYRIGLLQERAGIAELEATDEEIQEAYDAYVPKVKARHILVETEEEANEIIKSLNNGADFAELAKEKSIDTASGANGGELGWFGEGEMVDEFETAAYALDVNEISAPVKSTYGYHIIQVTDKETKGTLEEMKDELAYDVKVSKLTNEIMAEAMERELKEAGVKVNDKELSEILGF